jgi:alkane 1-monooxygenase
MILIALVPAWWRRVMDPRVLAHYGGDVSRANLSPRKRARLLARYPAPSAPSGPAAAVAVPAVAHPMASAGGQPDGPARGGRCPGCGYVYDESLGDAREGFPAGTPWSQIPATWSCPDCGVRDKVDFVLLPNNGGE